LYSGKAMREKLETFKFFDKLPNEIKGEVTPYLPNKDFINLSMTSKANSPFFGKNQPIEKQYEIRKYLHHVVRGNHEAVAKMLKKDLFLMCKRGQVRDLSNRTFPHISGFEYCMWALDMYTLTKMLDCLRTTKKREDIKAELLRQYQKIKEHGVTYTLKGVTKHYMPETTTKTETHFDFKGTIIEQLEEYVNKGDDNQWQTGVGGAQRLLPAHVVHEYCSDTPFHPVPDFKKQPKSSKEFYNLTTEKSESWFDANSKLGVNFAIYKMAGIVYSGAGGREWGCGALVFSRDLNAIKALYRDRTKDFQSLEDNLKPCNSSENKYNY